MVFEFDTPRLAIQYCLPSSTPDNLKPRFLIGFNQKIDPVQLFPFITVRYVDKSKSSATISAPIRLFNEKEDKSDITYDNYKKSLPNDYWIDFMLQDGHELPKNTYITITIASNAVSLHFISFHSS